MRVAPLLVLASAAACCAATALAAPSYNYVTSWSMGSSNAYDVVIGADGLVYISGGFSNLKKFDTSGTALGTIGSGLGGSAQFVARDPGGNFYVTDLNHTRVVKFDPSGGLITAWGSMGSGPGQFNNPEGIALDADQNVYVSDGASHRIEKFDSNGNFLTQWTVVGAPWDIAVGPLNGHVYVAANSDIEVFDTSGNPLQTWANGAAGHFDFVTSVATDAAGNVYAAESANCWISVFDADGNYQGLAASPGIDPGGLNFNFGMGFDSAGNLYVADRDNRRIDKFSPSGVTPAQTTSWGRLKSLYR